MKMRLFPTLVSILVLSTAIGLADSYTITIPTGLNAIANQLNNGSGNTVDQLFPNPGGALSSILSIKTS